MLGYLGMNSKPAQIVSLGDTRNLTSNPTLRFVTGLSNALADSKAAYVDIGRPRNREGGFGICAESAGFHAPALFSNIPALDGECYLVIALRLFQLIARSRSILHDVFCTSELDRLNRIPLHVKHECIVVFLTLSSRKRQS